jgi:hypothetical protein
MVAFNVALGGLDRTVADQFLDIAERPTGLVDQPSGFGHEGPATGMGRTALEADLPED